MKASEIQYRHAYNTKGEIIDVSQLERSALHPDEAFTCISCGNPLIAKLGEIKQKHFCHKQVQNCSSETYLHKLAKETFAREYQACLDDKKPFYIELEIEQICNAYEEYAVNGRGQYGRQCYQGSELRKFDLTKRYTKVDVEKACNGFIADVLLSDASGEKNLLIEICVTHQISWEKRKSGLQIIEIDIEDEDDVSLFKEHIIRQTDTRVALVNIDVKPELANLCDRKPDFSCRVRIGLYEVEKETGDTFFSWQPIAMAYANLKNHRDIISFHRFIADWETSSINIACQLGAIEAYKAGVKVKTCWLCRYHADSHRYQSNQYPIFCKFQRELCYPSKAVKCEYYRPDPKCFPQLAIEKYSPSESPGESLLTST